MEHTTTVIKLVKHKSWYMPADAQAYTHLVSLGITSTRLHEDQMEIIKHVAKLKGFSIRGKHFESVFDEFTDELYKRWMRFPHRNVKFKKSSMVFNTTDAAAFRRAKNKSIPIIETKIRDFFQRWGFIGEFKFSENHDKVKLVVDYSFSASRKPVIKLKEDPKEVTKTILNLGQNRLVLWRDGKYLHWELEVQAADEWKPRTKGQCLHTEVSDPTASILLLLRSLDESDVAPDLSFDQQLKKANEERDAAVAQAAKLQEDLAAAKEKLRGAQDELKARATIVSNLAQPADLVHDI